MSLIVLSCNSITESEITPISKKDSINKSIEPSAIECGYFIEYKYEFHHFAPVDSKYLGIWPNNNRFNDINRLKELKEKFGISYFFQANSNDESKFSLALQAGFVPSKIMAQILPDSYVSKINMYGDIFAYYMDEPADNNLSIAGIRATLNNSGLSLVDFIISGYKRGEALQLYVEQTDQVLFSSYQHWREILPGIFVSWPVNQDQRSDWTDMKNLFGNKFSMTWVGAHKDGNEYNDLLGHAKNLNLRVVWYYQFQDLTDNYSNDNLYNFCQAAWEAGYLKRFSEKIRLEYRCISHTTYYPCQCSISNPDCYWQINRKIPTGQIKEDIYTPY
jgi:hypothetical protein